MSIRAGFCQFEVAYADPERNEAHFINTLAAAGEIDLLVFPELALSGYDLRDARHAHTLAEPFGEGRTSRLLQMLARDYGATLVAGYAERDGDVCYNACQLATPDGGLHNYRKVHLFNREKELFTPGDAPPPVIETPAGRIGLMICFDWFFPECARSLALRGAQIIAHPSNLVLPWCQRAMFARSVENRVFSITCNRIGTETQAGRALTFTGASQILSPRGEVLAQAPTDAPHIGLAEIDPGDADDKAVPDYNDLFADRRPELYPGLH